MRYSWGDGRVTIHSKSSGYVIFDWVVERKITVFSYEQNSMFIPSDVLPLMQVLDRYADDKFSLVLKRKLEEDIDSKRFRFKSQKCFGYISFHLDGIKSGANV